MLKPCALIPRKVSFLPACHLAHSPRKLSLKKVATMTYSKASLLGTICPARSRSPLLKEFSQRSEYPQFFLSELQLN